jgi:hypothetical protein
MAAYSELGKWLRCKPMPSKVRCIRDDGTAQIVEVHADKRGGWLEAEETIITLDPWKLEALSADEKIIHRARPFRDHEDEAGDDGSDDGKKKKKPAGQQMDRVIHAVGDAVRDAYKAGAEAASTAQDKLLSLVDKQHELVDKLTQHLSAAIENHHRTAAQLAAVSDPAEAMAMQLMGMNANGGPQQQPQQQGQAPTHEQAMQFVSRLSPQNRGLLQGALAAVMNGSNGSNGHGG